MSSTLKVLQVEDNPLDARLVKDMLASQGQVQLTQVEYLRDAKQCLKEHRYDVALLDLMLPDEKGVPSILALRASAPQLPIVVYTSLPSLNMAREALRAGAEDYAVKGHTDAFNLLRKLCTAIDRHQLKLGLYGQLDALNTENRQLQELSYHDPLTGLYNRRGLDLRLNHFSQGGEGAYATLIDIDDFKQVNDRFGHHVGDQLLQEVARALLVCSDEKDVLARIGGDEFLCVGLGGRARAEAQGQRLRKELAGDAVLFNLAPGLRLTCCQAITLLGRRQADLSALLEAAHAALAQGKVTGKDQVLGDWDLSGPAAPEADKFKRP